MVLSTWGNSLSGAFTGIWVGVIGILPNIVVAIVIFIVGWIIASLLARLVSQIIRAIKVDSLLQQAGFESVLKKAGLSLNVGGFLGALVKWFVIVAFLVASFEVLGLTQVNVFLQNVVLLYLPQVIVAVLILLVAVVIADAMQKIVVSSARAANVKSANFLGSVTRWAIWIFALLTALVQLGIAVTFIQTLFTGVVVALSIAFGLSFGLGGQEAASNYIAKFRQDIADHHHNQ